MTDKKHTEDETITSVGISKQEQKEITLEDRVKINRRQSRRAAINPKGRRPRAIRRAEARVRGGVKSV